ncbi:hypothetical protein SAMN05518871_103416 [Psychrobacillus sp. OK028]|uniref:hypothetical protein n=1 Tax=Psychrobacillus sp. OK028 TaxID=1884359 RepID=UPI00088B2D4B|nr:hypothetical protein [Psychrobacillus sp. OK028]SDN14300.1 hypothetical protein SAMN05518871_103416 [Psychrobacillus sp. OK028]
MKKIMSFIIVLTFILGACNKDEVKSEIYNSRDLSIIVIGDIPEVIEENITFTQKSLEDIAGDVKNTSNEFDAVFITPVQFAEADDDKYVETYQGLTIPTFFIESPKRHLPFVNENLTYETAPGIDGVYATGYLHGGTEEENNTDVWQYGLYNDVKNEVNIKDVYTRIFKTINDQVHK